MRHFTSQTKRIAVTLLIMALVCGAIVIAPLLSTANSRTTATEGASILITNNSSRSIKYLYLSPTDTEIWSVNKLTDTTLNPGQAVTLSVESCTGPEIKVIGEDGEGCYVTAIVSCAENAAWTITNEAVPDCGN